MRRSARKARRVTDAIWKTRETRAEGEKNVVGSVAVDPEYQENRKQAERGAQAAQGLSQNCSEGISPLSRLIRCFRKKYY